MQEDNYICRRYEKKLDLIAIHTEHFYHEQKEPMIIVTHTKSASIALIRQGRVTIRSGKHTVEANVGDILSFPKGIFYWAEWEGAPMLEFYSIHYKQPINVSGNVLSRLQRITINPPDADERFFGDPQPYFGGMQRKRSLTKLESDWFVLSAVFGNIAAARNSE